MAYRTKAHGSDNGYGKMSQYQEQNPRTTFMSVFPVSDYVYIRHKRAHDA